MDKITFIYLSGIFNLIVAVFHILFWKIFNWKVTLDKGTKANKAVTQLMNVNLIYLFLAMGFIYLNYANELSNSKIGKIILIMYAGFWVVRFIQQFIFVKIKGNFVIGLTFLFLIGAIFHLIPVLL